MQGILVNRVLESRIIDPYTLYYLGTIDYREVHKQVYEKRNEFFERYDAVWRLN